jgi:murein DD-endopeptidase MepM/ murein hydrolase activator NlpD
MKARILGTVLLLAFALAGAGSPPTGAVSSRGVEIPRGTENPRGIESARGTESPQTWSWPLPPKPQVLRAFDPPGKPWLSGHRGVDLRASAQGAVVTAPESGVISFVGVVVDRPVITIDHGNLKSSFEPVESTLTAGTPVSKGEVIGTIVTGHCGTIPCVHWGVRRGEDYLNPLWFVMDLRPSILLPLTEGGG